MRGFLYALIWCDDLLVWWVKYYLCIRMIEFGDTDVRWRFSEAPHSLSTASTLHGQ